VLPSATTRPSRASVIRNCQIQDFVRTFMPASKHNVIHYDKKKASDSNWYTYTWFLKKDRVHELMSDKLKQELTDLSKKLEFEQNYTYYKCYNGCDKLAFEIAFEYNFKCPECGNLMNQINNNTEKKQLSGRIGEIKKFLNTA